MIKSRFHSENHNFNDLNLEVKISKLAIGVPIGTDMEYIDALTLELAIDERKNVN